ncbi:MAG: NosD domain-containing protein [Candidatus Kariarchaeaceae archaeon]
MLCKRMLLILIVIHLISVTYYIPLPSNGLVGNPREENSSNISLSGDYISHGQISITSDEMFAKYDFEGAGTADSPFLIQGLNITTTATCILICNTSKHVLISDCWLKSGDEFFGFYPSGVNVSSGILVYSIAPNTISIVNNVFVEGVQAVSAHSLNGIFLSDNIVYDTRIISFDATNVQIVNNEFHNGTIEVQYLNDSEIRSNSCFEGGIHILKSFNITIHGNFAKDGDRGIYLFYTHNNLITWNNLINNEYGLSLAFSHNNLIHHNTFINNSRMQAGNFGSNNIWYDPETLEGNWWSDYNGTGVYTFDYGATDYYPLIFPEEDSNLFEVIALIITLTLVIVGLSTAIILYLKKRQNMV